MFHAEAEVGHDVRIVLALVADVVNREHACRIRQRRENVVPRLEKHGHDRRRPIVRVHDVWDKAEVLADLQGRLRQEREAKRVVHIMAGRPVVDARPPEVRVVFEKPDRHLVVEQRFMQPDPMLNPRAQMHARGSHGPDAEFRAVDQRVQGEQHPSVVAEPPQRLRQSANHVRKAAHLGKRRAFGCDEENLQTVLFGRCIPPVSLSARNRPFQFGCWGH